MLGRALGPGGATPERGRGPGGARDGAALVRGWSSPLRWGACATRGGRVFATAPVSSGACAAWRTRSRGGCPSPGGRGLRRPLLKHAGLHGHAGPVGGAPGGRGTDLVLPRGVAVPATSRDAAGQLPPARVARSPCPHSGRARPIRGGGIDFPRGRVTGSGYGRVNGDGKSAGRDARRWRAEARPTRKAQGGTPPHRAIGGGLAEEVAGFRPDPRL